MFSQQDTIYDTIGMGSVAQKGNYLSALTINSEKSDPWIVDSGATLFYDYNTCQENLTVKIADGSLSGTGSIII